MSRCSRSLLLATTALVPLTVYPALANPIGAQVVGGAATVQGQGTAAVTVKEQTNSAIINWQQFNIGVNESTTFVQPNAASVILNRVTGNEGPSEILGSLTSNGKVFLVNPDGLLFGPGAVINTGSFLATTNDIANSDFMSGRYNFTIAGKPSASIVNEGSITARNGGFAALVAPGVRNDGVITATLGTVGLAAGNGFTLDFYGDKLITLGVSDSIASQVIDVATGQPLDSLVKNTGTLKADGGRVELTAAAARQVVDSVINNTGVIEANTIGTRKGAIVLSAAAAGAKPAGAPTQVVKVSGTLSAAGKKKGTKGGAIVVTGESIKLASATLDASGLAGGGKVLVGGDTGGGKPNAVVAGISEAALEAFAVPNATNVSFDARSSINVSAIDSGNGGKAIVWADGTTSVAGTILARGGAKSGDGGFVETSGHVNLAFGGSVDIGAAFGKSGTWLLDPTDVTIASTGPWVVTPTAIENALATGDVVVTTPASGADQGNITVAENVTWANANSLTLSAYQNITINDGVTISNTGAGNLSLRADNAGTGIGTVSFLGTGKVDFSLSTGLVSIFYNPADNPAGSAVNSASYTSPTNYGPYVITNSAVPNQLTAYMLVNSVYDLQNIENNLSGDYALGKDVDASATAAWNGGVGFVPIGYSSFSTTNSVIPDGHGPLVGVNATPTKFVGIFDGLDHTVSNITINNTGAFNLGMFSWIGSQGIVRNVGLLSGNLIGGDGYQNFGLLAGWNFGTISNTYATGTVSVGNFSNAIGGLVGWNWTGTIANSYASVTVTGGNQSSYIGGLVGEQGYGVSGSIITDSYATGNVTGGNNSDSIGGLVGDNNGAIIRETYAIGNVTGGNASTNIGGLAGSNSGYWGGDLITDSYATGNVTGGSAVGGLLGSNTWSGVVTNSYAITTAQLKLTLPSGFDPTVWGISASINNGYPYLLWQTAAASPPKTTTLYGGPAPTPPTMLQDPFGSGQKSFFKSAIPSGPHYTSFNGDILATLMQSPSAWQDINNIYSLVSFLESLKDYSQVYSIISELESAGLVSPETISTLRQDLLAPSENGLTAAALNTIVDVLLDQLQDNGYQLPAPKSVLKSVVNTALNLWTLDLPAEIVSQSLLIMQEAAALNATSAKLVEAFINSGFTDVLDMQKANELGQTPEASKLRAAVSRSIAFNNKIANELTNGSLWPSQIAVAGEWGVIQYVLQAKSYQLQGKENAANQQIAITKSYAEMLDNQSNGAYSTFASLVAARYGVIGW